jgi:hypothetical protein
MIFPRIVSGLHRQDARGETEADSDAVPQDFLTLLLKAEGRTG